MSKFDTVVTYEVPVDYFFGVRDESVDKLVQQYTLRASLFH